MNVDLYPSDGTHRLKEDREIGPGKIPNFIQCDAHILPFRPRVFSVVHSYHVLEHLHSPLEALREWSRVCHGRVVLTVPDLQLSRIYGEFEPHIYSWSKWSLEGLMSLVFLQVHVKVLKRPLQFTRAHKLSHLINFLLKRAFIHIPFFQNTELQGEGIFDSKTWASHGEIQSSRRIDDS